MFTPPLYFAIFSLRHAYVIRYHDDIFLIISLMLPLFRLTFRFLRRYFFFTSDIFFL